MARLAVCILALFAVAAAPDALAATSTTRHDRQDRGQKPHTDGPQAGRERRDRWKWWLHNRAELNISDRQSAEIDKIFEATVPGQRARREELERLEASLSAMTSDTKVDVATVAQQAEKVENLRAEMGKTRTVMLYRMNLLLTPEQRVKVKALIDKREAERGKNPDSSRRR